ncbi:Scn11a [Symbiodinium pilosum]|uniref:Scn11a protein n=1 Tax=Symbiodinium pilosum TaxID=2952 RepID=A0A812WY41_SYMPI|nr:Scn11a [Symbiodinium pilosum]
MMGIQADWMVAHIGQTAPEAFDMFENLFAVIFTCELAMRILVYHIRFFRTAEWKWNLFDSVVVGLQIIDIVSTIAVGPDANVSSETGNLSFMRIIRLMRLLRILRLMRLLRFVQELRSMVMSIAASLKSLMWTIILLAFLMYGVGVCLTQMIADRGLEEPRIMVLSPDLKSYYGSLPEALVSLFQGITGGIDWNDLLEPLEEQISPWLAVVFVLYIAFAVLAMMNVVTGIFVESALQSTRADEEKEVRAQLDDMFKSLENPEMKRCFESLGFDMAEAYGLFNLLDTDQSGEIDCEELLEGCLRLRGSANAIDVATLQYSSKRVFEWWRGKMSCVEELLACILEILEQAAGFATMLYTLYKAISVRYRSQRTKSATSTSRLQRKNCTKQRRTRRKRKRTTSSTPGER